MSRPSREEEKVEKQTRHLRKHSSREIDSHLPPLSASAETQPAAASRDWTKEVRKPSPSPARVHEGVCLCVCRKRSHWLRSHRPPFPTNYTPVPGKAPFLDSTTMPRSRAM